MGFMSTIGDVMGNTMANGIQQMAGDNPLAGGIADVTRTLPRQIIGNPSVGMGVGMDYRSLPGVNPVAEQTQQMANNPIYTETSPFQPPQAQTQPLQANPLGGQAAVGGGSSGGGKAMGMMPGQLVGGAFGKPIFRGPAMEPYQPNPLQGTPMAQPQFTGGLRPAPTNYRPPIRAGGILRRRMR